MTNAPTNQWDDLVAELVTARADVERLTEERDQYAAIIAGVRVQNDAARAIVAEHLLTPNAEAALDLTVRGLDKVLTADPTATLAARDAEKKAEALEAARTDLHNRANAELDGKREGDSTTRRIAFAQGVELGKKVLRELAATARTPQQGEMDDA